MTVATSAPNRARFENYEGGWPSHEPKTVHDLSALASQAETIKIRSGRGFQSWRVLKIRRGVATGGRNKGLYAAAQFHGLRRRGHRSPEVADGKLLLVVEWHDADPRFRHAEKSVNGTVYGARAVHLTDAGRI